MGHSEAAVVLSMLLRWLRLCVTELARLQWEELLPLLLREALQSWSSSLQGNISVLPVLVTFTLTPL